MLLILSQVPPPVHGSTKMTLLFIDMLKKNTIHFRLVDRRFSQKIEDINKFKLKKIANLISIILRLVSAIISQIRNQKNSESCCRTIIIFSSTSKYAFYVDAMASEIGHLFRRRVILYFHTSTEDVVNWGVFKRNWFMRTVNQADHIVLLSRTLELQLLRHSPNARTSIIPNTIGETKSTTCVSQKIVLSEKIRKFLYLSNLIPQKGLLDFIEFARYCVTDIALAKFTVIGPVVDKIFYETALRLVANYGLRDNFEFLGFVDGKIKYNELARSDFLIFPSHYREAQPMVILESLSVGTPVVAYDIPGIRDIIQDRVNGFVTEPNPKSILESIKTIIDSQSQMTLLRKSSIDFFNLNFSSNRFETKWLNLINQS